MFSPLGGSFGIHPDSYAPRHIRAFKTLTIKKKNWGCVAGCPWVGIQMNIT
jgi:hypothetical protein